MRGKLSYTSSDYTLKVQSNRNNVEYLILNYINRKIVYKLYSNIYISNAYYYTYTSCIFYTFASWNIKRDNINVKRIKYKFAVQPKVSLITDLSNKSILEDIDHDKIVIYHASHLFYNLHKYNIFLLRIAIL